MKILNPFKLNEWSIKKIISIVFLLQIIILSMSYFNYLNIPILKPLAGFIYLTFIPGYLILRVLKISELNSIQSFLFATGLSISCLIFTAFFLNLLLPLIGFLRPISFIPLFLAISLIVIILVIISILQKSKFPNIMIDLNCNSFAPSLFLFLIPFISIIGTYMVNINQSNNILIFLIILIGIIVLLISFNGFIPKNLYPLAIFVVSISLLFHTSLISNYLWGWDIHGEYYYATNVLNNGFWDWNISNAYNGVLSTNFLSVYYAIVCGIDISWVFKIIYPFIFSLLPIGIYEIVKKQFNSDKIAFLSGFFVASFFVFFTEMVSLARQQIAEIFLVLILLILLDKKRTNIKYSFIMVLFSAALVVSHYSISYIFILILIFTWLLLFMSNNNKIRDLFSKITHKNLGSDKKIGLNLNFIILFIVFTLAWYIYVSQSTAFESFINIINQVTSNIYGDFLNPETSQALSIIQSDTISPLRSIFKYLQLSTQFFIFIGLISIYLKKYESKIDKAYLSFLTVSFVICIITIAAPYVSGSLNTSRIYHIALIFLAPLAIIGGLMIIKIIYSFFRMPSKGLLKSSMKLLGCFFVLFLFFNTGLVYEIIGDHPNSIAISQQSIEIAGNQKEKMALYNSLTTEYDVFSARWISENKEDGVYVFGDASQHYKAILSYGKINYYRGALKITNSSSQKSGYVYLTYLNVEHNLITVLDENSEVQIYNSHNYSLINSSNEIYSNGYSKLIFF